MTSTGRLACSATSWETLPSISSLSPVRPSEPRRDQLGVDLVRDLDDPAPGRVVHLGSRLGVEAGVARERSACLCLCERSVEDGSTDVGGARAGRGVRLCDQLQRADVEHDRATAGEQCPGDRDCVLRSGGAVVTDEDRASVTMSMLTRPGSPGAGSARTIRTGRFGCCATLCETLPSKSSRGPCKPRDPSTIRDQEQSRAEHGDDRRQHDRRRSDADERGAPATHDSDGKPRSSGPRPLRRRSQRTW